MLHTPVISRIDPIGADRLARAKRAFSTRRVTLPGIAFLETTGAPRPGDIVLARVEEIGHHTKLELTNGRRAGMYVGDEILVAYGNRYAPDQFEAVVPDDLGPCRLVAAGGIAAKLLSKSDAARQPTRIRPVGVVTGPDGERLNTMAGALAPGEAPQASPAPVVAVLGSSMNAGKTTTMASMIHGEARAGRRVAAVKCTGTGSGGDLWAYLDAGAEVALDFTDAGLPSTAGADAAMIERTLGALLRSARGHAPDIIFLEVADGILFDETAELLASATFRAEVAGVVFAAADALGAITGEKTVRAAGGRVLAISGRMTRSPLAVREADALTDAPILFAEACRSGEWLASETLRGDVSDAA